MDNELDQPSKSQHWMDRAAEVRAKAAEAREPMAREVLEETARIYDEIADIEAKHEQQGGPGTV